MTDTDDAGKDSPAGVLRIRETAVLKALTHPARAQIIDLLGVYGPCTVGWLAERTGLAAGSVSHHLTVLAGVNLIEQAEGEGTDRRQAWWRRSASGVIWSAAQMDDTSGRLIAEAAEVHALQQRHELALRWLTERDERPEWRSVAFVSQDRMWLNPEEMASLMRDLDAVAQRYKAIAEREGRGGREPVVLWSRAFPNEP